MVFYIYRMKITSYNEFLLEKEFQRILESLRLITESEDTYKLGDTIEWDLKKDKGTPDEPALEMEWTFKPKSKIQKMKDKVSDFTNWLREDDPEIDWSDFSDGVNPNNPIIMFKNFIEKIKDKEKIKEYFIRVIKQIKSLPTNIKRDLLKKLLLILAVYCNTINVPLSNIVTSDVKKTEPITAEIITEIESSKEQQPTKKIKLSKEIEKFASFDRAHNMVMAVEGGYSADRADKGNYTNCKGESIFIGTNHGIATPTLIEADVLPRGNTNTQTKEKYECETSPEKMKELFRTSYGKNYDKLCGTDEKTFAEQWELDQKHIVDHKDIETKWNKIMRHLSDETALDIYQKYYWTPQSFDMFKSQSIANVLYDACVNQGSGAALSVLRNSMESLGHNVEDIGSWDEFHEKLTPTVNKMNDAETENLFELIKKERIKRYKSADTFKDHGTGWTDRVKDLTFVDDNTKDSDLS